MQQILCPIMTVLSCAVSSDTLKCRYRQRILNVVINAATFALNREGIPCQVRLQDFELAIEGVKKAKKANCQV